MQADGEKLTRSGDLPGVIHDDIEYVPDRHITIAEVVRSTDGRCGVRGQVGGGGPARDRELPRRYVVFGTPVDRDVVCLGSLQNKTDESVNVVVHVLTPRQRSVQDVKERT